MTKAEQQSAYQNYLKIRERISQAIETRNINKLTILIGVLWGMLSSLDIEHTKTEKFNSFLRKNEWSLPELIRTVNFLDDEFSIFNK